MKLNKIYSDRQRSSLKADTRRLQFSSVQCPQGTECRSRQSAFNLNGRIMKKIQRVIYRATHQQSEHGKLGYIGCALYGMEERRKVHLRDANRGTFTSMTFHRAIRKYGTKIWHWEVLESGFSDHKSMLEAEKKWIKQNGKKFR